MERGRKINGNKGCGEGFDNAIFTLTTPCVRKDVAPIFII